MMRSQDLCEFLICYVASACLLVIVLAGRRKSLGRWGVIGASLALLAVGVAAGSAAMPGRNSLVQAINSLGRLDRLQVAAVVAGVLCGLLAGLALDGGPGTRGRQVFGLGVHAGVVLLLSLLVLKDQVSPYLANPHQASASGSLVVIPVTKGFRIEEYARLGLAPTCLAVGPDRRLYVAGYAGVSNQNGVVVRLERDERSGTVKETVVADYLNRPHGIAFHGPDLYVSRAGQYSRATQGRIVQESTGAVTRLADLDGDGVYDFYDDVISGLPGAQQPDGLHQNNGIAFDDKGYLYVTVGAPTDHGPAVHPFAGTILRARADGSELGVFARGFRNPYGIAIGPSGALFCTDNDANNLNAGDTLHRVVPGGHHGFPYTAIGGSLKISGAVKPLLRSGGTLEGLAYAPSGCFPPGFDDCLYAASFDEGQVKRIKFDRDVDGDRVNMDDLARVPGVVDVAVSPEERAIYACSFDQRMVYRITPE